MTQKEFDQHLGLAKTLLYQRSVLNQIQVMDYD